MSDAPKTPRKRSGRSHRLGRSALTGTWIMKPVAKLSAARRARIRKAVREVIASRHN